MKLKIQQPLRPLRRCRNFSTIALQESAETTPASPQDTKTLSQLLQRCSNADSARQAHAHIYKNRLYHAHDCTSKLLDMYSMWGFMKDAQKLFDRIPNEDTSLWNIMVRGYCIHGPFSQAISIYNTMKYRKLDLDRFNYGLLLKACGALVDPRAGNGVYTDAVGKGYANDCMISSSAILMFLKSGDLGNARHVFDKMPVKNVALWSILIAGFVQNGDPYGALRVFSDTLLNKMKPDGSIIARILPACEILHGREVHCFVIREGMNWNPNAELALADMYTRCSFMMDAIKFIDNSSIEDSVSLWNVVIKGYTLCGDYFKAIDLFRKMRVYGIKPDASTLVNLIKACDGGCAKQVLSQLVVCGYFKNVSVGNSLLSFYARSGESHMAKHLFDIMPLKDSATWGILISGYVINGLIENALIFLRGMKCFDVVPNEICCLSGLWACATMRDLQHGKEIHSCVIGRGYHWSNPQLDGAFVHMYAQCGVMDCAWHVYCKMRVDTRDTWDSMINGNGIHEELLEALENVS